MNKTLALTALALAFAASSAANAAVIQSVGAGSAVSTVNASANFESQNALNDNPYVEDGLSFSRTGLSFDNNSCGFAGCDGHLGFVGFSGNYMYGVGTGSFTMSTTGGNVFSGLEFLVGTGFFSSSVENITWSALLNGSIVGSGSISSLATGSVISFADAGGFDTLVYTSSNSGTFAPAFDSVRAQYVGTSAVPVPAAAWLFGTGLVGLAGLRRKVAA